MKNRYIAYIIGVPVLLAGCKITQQYEKPDIQTPATYRGAQTATDTSTLADIRWQELFSDPQLRTLIQQGLDSNLNLKIAVARMKAAAANLRQSKDAFWPTLSVSPSFTHAKPSPAQLRAFGNSSATSIPSYDQYSLVGTASWEIDVWGKLRSTKRSRVALFLASDAYRRTVQTQLIANIANNYYTLLALDQQLKITQQTVEIRKNDVSTIKALKEAAVLTGADVVNSEANRYAAEVSIPDIKRSIRETENALSVLLGVSPDSIPRSILDQQQAVDFLRTGVPVHLLSNRPDVQQAEYSLISNFELTNAARTYFYPQLNLSATGGFATVNTLKGFFDQTFYWNLVAGLTQPIFNQGLNRQRLRVAEANQEEALYNFKSVMLTASQEVADALFSYQTAVDKASIRQNQLASLQKAVEFNKELLRYSSSTNYTDVLTAEQNLLTAQLNGINDKLQQLQAMVTLYRALGGGWKQ
ncbi:TolC family protein [Chitinophaga sedimenti]|uniref:efflux transporter outer membrane subunit n=1 Tax=Chitinophaga sedimenti TaxID=2033606 RepID=UPI002003B99E|nr:TolC family protein [Chitinophaga sedimenti]MCK7554825.1 TolC family protein [Chitinophaga sedimenti]